MTLVGAPPVESSSPSRVAPVAPMAVAGEFVTSGSVTMDVVKLCEGEAQEVPLMLAALAVK